MKNVLILSVFLLFVGSATADEKPHVFFVQPQNGATVPQKFKVVFGVSGMAIEPAGPLKDGTGHHHLIINGTPVTKNQVVPKDETHLHFGKGETETEITLKPGRYKLTMQFADGAHRSYGHSMSETITVTVK